MWNIIKMMKDQTQDQNAYIFGNYNPLCGSANVDFFPFLMDNIKIKPYFYKRRDFYDNKPYHNPKEYVKYQISDDEEIKHFLYDVELYYRQSKGDQKMFRQKLIDKELYELFNILFWMKPISDLNTNPDVKTNPELNNNPDKDPWELLGANLLSGWYHIYLPNYNFTTEEIMSDIRNFSKYDRYSF